MSSESKVKKQAEHGLVVLSATYGGPDVEGRMNVTEFLRSKVVNGRLRIKVTNNFFGRDPVPGIVKVLVITYTLDGEEHTKMIPETWNLILPDEESVKEVVDVASEGVVEGAADAAAIERRVAAAVAKVQQGHSETKTATRTQSS